MEPHSGRTLPAPGCHSGRRRGKMSSDEDEGLEEDNQEGADEEYDEQEAAGAG